MAAKEKEPSPRTKGDAEEDVKPAPPKELTRQQLEEIRRKLQKKY